MPKRTKCQVCGRELGTEVQPGEFCFDKVLRRADVAQVCVGCLSDIPEEIQADLRKRPGFFAANAIKKRRYQHQGVGDVRFPDRRKVFSPNIPELLG